MQGIVKWFSIDKGYGFIISDDGEDHYFDVKGVSGANLPSIGDIVKYKSSLGKKGPRAYNVEIVKKSQVEVCSKDDRVKCPQCDKKIVPRLIVYQGSVTKSVCPYCAALIKDFRSHLFRDILLFLIQAFVALVLFGIILLVLMSLL